MSTPPDNNSDSKDPPPSTDGNSGGSRGGDLRTELPDSALTPPEPEAASSDEQEVISSIDAVQ